MVVVSRLRIISGEFGGRLIKAPDGRTTHPMGDRVRSALFARVEVQGKRVLDLYAGSGAIGLEALSRGAVWADFVENDKSARRVIEDNIKALDVAAKTKLYKVSATIFPEVAQKLNKVYDVVFVDPPYQNFKKNPDGTFDFSTVSALKNIVKPKGLVVLSYSGRLCVPTVNGVVVVDDHSYGEAALAVFRFED